MIGVVKLVLIFQRSSRDTGRVEQAGGRRRLAGRDSVAKLGDTKRRFTSVAFNPCVSA